MQPGSQRPTVKGLLQCRALGAPWLNYSFSGAYSETRKTIAAASSFALLSDSNWTASSVSGAATGARSKMLFNCHSEPGQALFPAELRP